MLGKCFFIICAVSAVCAVMTGNTAGLSEAVFEGCRDSVELSFSLMGMMCLWCGVMEVFREAGLVDKLAQLLRPVLRRIFPGCADDREVMGDIASSVAANMLGVAGAATPYAISAMEKLDLKNGCDGRASDDMVTLSLLGCSSISLFPTTVVTLRHAAGSAAPYAVLVPVWICSAVCTVFAVSLSRLTAKDGRNKERKPSDGTSFVPRDPCSSAVGRTCNGSGQKLL